MMVFGSVFEERYSLIEPATKEFTKHAFRVCDDAWRVLLQGSIAA